MSQNEPFHDKILVALRIKYALIPRFSGWGILHILLRYSSEVSDFAALNTTIIAAATQIASVTTSAISSGLFVGLTDMRSMYPAMPGAVAVTVAQKAATKYSFLRRLGIVANLYNVSNCISWILTRDIASRSTSTTSGRPLFPVVFSTAKRPLLDSLSLPTFASKNSSTPAAFSGARLISSASNAASTKEAPLFLRLGLLRRLAALYHSKNGSR
jgi:hypothetical protein